MRISSWSFRPLCKMAISFFWQTLKNQIEVESEVQSIHCSYQTRWCNRKSERQMHMYPCQTNYNIKHNKRKREEHHRKKTRRKMKKITLWITVLSTLKFISIKMLYEMKKNPLFGKYERGKYYQLEILYIEKKNIE